MIVTKLMLAVAFIYFPFTAVFTFMKNIDLYAAINHILLNYVPTNLFIACLIGALTI